MYKIYETMSLEPGNVVNDVADATAPPPSVPDVLMPVDLSTATNVMVETNILQPVSHNYNSTNGGTTKWVFPAKGYCNMPNVAINFELVNGASSGAGTDRSLSFPLWSGGLSCINRATFRCGGQILSQITNAGLYSTIKTGFNTLSYRKNVLDARHRSQNGSYIKINTLPPHAVANFTTGSEKVGYQQYANAALDQSNIWCCMAEGGRENDGVRHVKQTSNLIRDFDNAGKGPNVVVRLADLFPFFETHTLPLFAMAQCELEIEWNKGVAPTVQTQNITADVVVNADIARTGTDTGCDVSFAAEPELTVDYLHYEEAEMEKVREQINGGGLQFNFVEVVETRGLNPELTDEAANQKVSSNHLLGMAGKELKQIYVVKNPNVLTQPNAALNDCLINKNTQLRQFKSQQLRDEAYNFVINNIKYYNRDIDKPSQQHHYLSECGYTWNCLPGEFDTMNYNVNITNLLGNSKRVGDRDAASADSGKTMKFLAGSKNVIGLCLDKYPELGAEPGNGTRIGSAPVEFEYSNTKTRSNPVADTDDYMRTDLTFFLEHRRSIIITPLGIDVRDT